MNKNQIAYIIYMKVHNAQPEIFQGRGGFLILGHFDKHFLEKSGEKSPAAENFGTFCPRYS